MFGQILMFGLQYPPLRQMLVPESRHEKGRLLWRIAGEMAHALLFHILRQRRIKLVELAQVRLQLLAFHKALVLPEEQWHDSFVQVVTRGEHHAKWEVVKVGDIYLVVRLVCRADARDEVRRDRKVEEQI